MIVVKKIWIAMFFKQRELDLRELRAKTAPKVFQVWAILSVRSKVRKCAHLTIGCTTVPQRFIKDGSDLQRDVLQCEGEQRGTTNMIFFATKNCPERNNQLLRAKVTHFSDRTKLAAKMHA